MRMVKLGAIDLPTALLYLGSALCYAAWLTSIVFAQPMAPGCCCSSP